MDEPTCPTEGCDKPVKARNMCGACWKRWRDGLKKAGLPLPPPEPKPKPICKVQGCDENAGRRSGYCFDHYQRNWKTGDPLTPDRRKSRALPVGERFWLKVNKDGPIPAHRPELGPCWVWTGGKMSSGYGNFNRGVAEGGGHVGAHRFAYELLVKLIPDDLDLDHLCHPGDGSCTKGTKCPHRLCVNPAHLEPVPHRENVRRGISVFAANMAVMHCPQGHEYTPENTRVRIGRSGYENRSCKQCQRDAHPPTGKINPLIAANAAKTHCPNGHEYTPENTIIDKSAGGKNGGRRCKTCRREQRQTPEARAKTAGYQRAHRERAQKVGD